MFSFNAEMFANEKVLELVTSPCCSEGFLLDLSITKFSVWHGVGCKRDRFPDTVGQLKQNFP